MIKIRFTRLLFLAVNQYYEAQVYDLFVIKGNAAVFKCHIPSFVSDHVEIIAWRDTAGGEYAYPSDYGTHCEFITDYKLILPFHVLPMFFLVVQ